jgi:quercetin dioxygenase-like cupin family protein
VLALGILGGTAGQAQDITRTLLQKWEIPEAAAYDINTLHVVIKAGGTSGRHTHPGAESSYVISGEPVLRIDGEPDHDLKAGDYFLIAPGAVHEVIARGSEPVVLVLSYVTERGKPLVSPAP